MLKLAKNRNFFVRFATKTKIKTAIDDLQEKDQIDIIDKRILWGLLNKGMKDDKLLLQKKNLERFINAIMTGNRKKNVRERIANYFIKKGLEKS